MDKKERAELIRKGNELFNRGEVKKALEIFVKTKYRDGITRVADYYYFDQKQPLVAVKFYQMVNRKDRVNEIYDRMIYALSKWLGKDTENDSPYKINLPPPKVSPKLKILAEEILRDQEKTAGD